MDYTAELSKIEQTVNNAKLEKATLEERQRKLIEEQTKILEELKKEEITEDKLEENIDNLEVSIQKGIEECQEVLK